MHQFPGCTKKNIWQESQDRSSKPAVHTVAEMCDSRRISPLSRRFRRQTHFSVTVWTGLKAPSYQICMKQRADVKLMRSWLPSWPYRVIMIKKPDQSMDSMCIYLKNIPAKFPPDPIWNDGAFKSVAPTRTRRRIATCDQFLIQKLPLATRGCNYPNCICLNPTLCTR